MMGPMLVLDFEKLQVKTIDNFDLKNLVSSVWHQFK